MSFKEKDGLGLTSATASQPPCAAAHIQPAQRSPDHTVQAQQSCTVPRSCHPAQSSAAQCAAASHRTVQCSLGAAVLRSCHPVQPCPILHSLATIPSSPVQHSLVQPLSRAVQFTVPHSPCAATVQRNTVPVHPLSNSIQPLSRNPVQCRPATHRCAANATLCQRNQHSATSVMPPSATQHSAQPAQYNAVLLAQPLSSAVAHSCAASIKKKCATLSFFLWNYNRTGLAPSSSSSSPMAAIATGSPTVLHGSLSSPSLASRLIVEEDSAPPRSIPMLESPPLSPSGSLPLSVTTDPSQNDPQLFACSSSLAIIFSRFRYLFFFSF
ncbi:hypothetical protein Acr_01g0006180 [Actinidia rufa]|uniref:Uncharacterized protein n=1 Tax=Actinidia rufa TaxID=165716 RepID=A0A7J0E4E2_9ERIC|nr:hypothetical protein Acr_01g0006180 [Actinidia rufa]